MTLLTNYYKKIITYDLLNKFNYNNINKLPKIKKIVLNFGCKSFEAKKLATALLALELISAERPSLTKSSKSNIRLKIRKGQPVGCAVVLKKEQAYSFLFKLLIEVFPKLKNFSGFNLNKKASKSFSFTIKELIVFSDLDSHFYLFSILPALNVTIVTDHVTQAEFEYLIKAFKLPIKN